MSKVIVLDCGFLAFRSILSFRVAMTMPIAHTYLSMLISNLKIAGAKLDDTIILAKDSRLGSWRREIVPEYKANRKENREKQEDADWWSECFKETDEILNKINLCLPYHIICVDFCEADDVASVCCKVFKDRELILVSSDSDWTMLLINKNVKILSIITKKFKTVENPLQVLQDKIMKGDRADNLIGKPQTEEELIKRRTVVNLLELPDYVENPIKEKLLNLPIKNIEYNKIPFRSLRERVWKLYNEGGANGYIR